MSSLGILPPGPKLPKQGLHSHPKIAPDGKLLKPYANTERVKVTKSKTKQVIYFDLQNQESRTMKPESGIFRILKLAHARGIHVTAVKVFIALGKCGTKYYEVEDPLVAGNCIVHIIPRAPANNLLEIEGIQRLLGKDDYWYIPVSTTPITLRPIWDAERYL